MPVIKWDDFTGGEYGGLSPGLQSSNQWTGLNMFVYDDGRVGPRGGLNCLITSGLTIVDSHVSAVAVGNSLLIHAKNASGTHAIYECELDVASTYTHVLTGIAPAPWKPGGWVQTSSNTAYLAAHGKGVFKFVTGAPGTDTAIFNPGSSGGSCVATYRGRMYSGTNSDSTVYYSVLNDYDDWASTPGDGTDSGNFNVGDNQTIEWMGVVGDQLWFMKQSGEIWSYQGVPARDSLRRIVKGRASGSGTGAAVPVVDHPYQFDVTTAGTLVGGESFFPRPVTVSTEGAVDTNYILSKFKDEFNAEPYSDIGDDVGACITHERDGVALTFQDAAGANADTYTLIRRNGAWTVHKFEPSGLGTSPGGPAPGGTVCTPHGVLWTLISSNSETDLWPCYTVINANTPGDGVQTYAYHRQGDVFSSNVETAQHVDSCTFQTSYYMEPSGKDMTVRRVVIEFMAFDTNSSDTNHFDPTVELRASDDGQEQTITLDSWDEANASATSSGSPRRHVVTPAGGIQATMFSIKLSQIRGVAIESIRVEFDVDDTARR